MDISKVAAPPVQAPVSAPAVRPAAETPESAPPERRSRDEYVPEEPREPTGMYRLGKDGEGNPKVYVDGPEKEEKCTADTSQADAEIRALKEKKAELEKALKNARDDPEKQEQIQRQLEQVSEELRRKDNDTYRRQHTCFTNG